MALRQRGLDALPAAPMGRGLPRRAGFGIDLEGRPPPGPARPHATAVGPTPATGRVGDAQWRVRTAFERDAHERAIRVDHRPPVADPRHRDGQPAAPPGNVEGTSTSAVSRAG